jgi:hypothetical protein
MPRKTATSELRSFARHYTVFSRSLPLVDEESASRDTINFAEAVNWFSS